ncbi:exonuclease [Serratia phage JS26]|uniref:DUF2800 domain-containing protein n=1 Tax=Serratia phage JS26 TaxID=2315217 RepID=A0A5Q2F9I5_9CAUD|nr:exonuclease [Serratia phage JS26]QGF20870.1 hypothetical protein [Serratia phage JS26]
MSRGVTLEQLLSEHRDHSIFAPSGASRWLGCPGSLVPNLLAPDNSGYDAALGTVAHGVAEEWLTTGKRPKHRVGDVEWIINGGKLYQIEIDLEMLDFVERYVDWCLMVDGEMYIERKVDFSVLTPIPNQTGTSDCIVIQPRRLVVSDLKYGKGVQVYAENNPQGLLYAYGAFLEFDWLYGFEEIEIRICQPRLEHFDSWIITREDLLAFGEYVKERASLAWSLDAPRVAGSKQCTFCRVKADCPAMAKMAHDVTRLMFADEFELQADEITDLRQSIRDGGFDIDPPAPGKLNTSELASIVKFRKAVEAWFKTVEVELWRRACEGQTVPGYKLVEGRSNRAWKSESAAERLLLDKGVDSTDLYTVKMVSPTQAESLLKNNGYKAKELPDILQKLVTKPPGKPSLVPLHDKRPPISTTIRQMWDDEEEEGEED